MSLFKIVGRRLFVKIVIAFFIVIIPIGSLSLLMNQSGENIVREELLQSNSSSVHFFLSAFETEINRIQRVLREYASNDEDFQKVGVIPESMDDFERAQTILRIENKLSILHSSSPYIQEIKIYFPKLDKTILGGKLGDSISQEELDAIKNGPSSGGSPFIYFEDRLMIGIIFPAYGRTSFAIEAQLSLPLLKQTLAQMSNHESAGSILLDARGNWSVSDRKNTVIMEPIRSQLEQFVDVDLHSGQERVVLDGQSYLLYYEHSPELSLTLIHYMLESQSMGALKQYRVWYWVLALASLIVVIVYSNLIYIYIHRPMRRLVNGLRQIGKGHLGVRLQHRSNDEFQDVYLQFNTMVEQVQTLIDEVSEQKLQAQRSELKQLQSQINPHFLYNCLFILLTLIRSKELVNAENLVKHLGNYFRFVTRNGEDEITLEKEVLHAQAYVGIQSVRFPDIRIEWHPFPASSSSIVVPRLFLQPILENAYQHGLELNEGIGKLIVEATDENGILSIRIENNGAEVGEGLIQELTARLESQHASKETTGIINVHRRLRLKYGKEYGLKLSRGKLGGLLVTVVIPSASQAMEEEPEDHV